MKIKKVWVQPILSGFYFDDQLAIKMGASRNGSFFYRGKPKTKGYSSIRQPGEGISVILQLQDGQIAFGDCVAVQYSGAAERDPLFSVSKYLNLTKKIAKKLEGEELSEFRSLAKKFDQPQIHTSIRYGISQAILEAVAKSQKMTMAEIIAKEYQLKLTPKAIPIFVQTGDERYLNAEKAIIKRADILPHGLINNIQKFGSKGERLIEYLLWLKQKVKILAKDSRYRPIFHLDVYGMVGLVFRNEIEKIISYIRKLERTATPHLLQLENPVDLGNKIDQIKFLKKLRERLKSEKIRVKLVADEWCNTLEDLKDFAQAQAVDMIQVKMPDLGAITNSIEAILYCKKMGIGAYLGGSCNETDKSAIVSAHLALATFPDQVLAKPTMDPDAALMIMKNEIKRTLCLLKKGKF